MGQAFICRRGGGDNGLIKQPKYTTDWPPDVYPFNAPNKTLDAGSNLGIAYSYSVYIPIVHAASCVDVTSDTSLSNTVATVGNSTVLLIWVTRSATSTPAGWTLVHSNPLLSDFGYTQYMNIAYKNTGADETSVSVTVTCSTAGRIYSNLISLTSPKTVTYVSETSGTASITFDKPSSAICLYSMQADLWPPESPFASYTTNDAGLTVYSTSPTTPGRLGNIVDEKGIRSITITHPSESARLFNLVICTLT